MARSECIHPVFILSLTMYTIAQKNKVALFIFLYAIRALLNYSSKATEYHLGLLKAKLARYRAELLEPTSKSGGAGTGFEVQKSGDARVALIGFPSVGKVCSNFTDISIHFIHLRTHIVNISQQDDAHRICRSCI